MNVRRGSERSLWLKWAKKAGFLEVGTFELSLEGWVGSDDHGDWEMILGAENSMSKDAEVTQTARKRQSPESVHMDGPEQDTHLHSGDVKQWAGEGLTAPTPNAG